jgi:hypothetical protein
MHSTLTKVLELRHRSHGSAAAAGCRHSVAHRRQPDLALPLSNTIALQLAGFTTSPFSPQ